MLRYVSIVLWFVACNSKPGVKTQFDNLEKVFETGNWEVIAQGDTGYLFFSREGERFFRVYNYTIVNGDSVSTEILSIQKINGKIIFDKAELKRATETGSTWELNGKVMQFQKRDSLHIEMISDTNKLVMRRTLPISAFLVRKKYDFLHGTHIADTQ